MVVFAPGRELVRLAHEVLVLGGSRFLEQHRLEVTSRYRLTVVPANFECFYTHCHRCLSLQRGVIR